MPRFTLVRGSCVVLLCALLAGGLIGRRSSARLHTEPGQPSETISHPAASSVSPPAPIADAAVSPRLQLERQCLALAEHDPLAAMELALKKNLTADDPGLLTNLILQWASRDFDAAYAWTKTQEAGAWRDNTLAHVAYHRAQTDPLASARIVVTDMAAGAARDEATISVVHQWALRAPAEARSWVETFDQGPLRQRAESELNGIPKPNPPRS